MNISGFGPAHIILEHGDIEILLGEAGRDYMRYAVIEYHVNYERKDYYFYEHGESDSLIGAMKIYEDIHERAEHGIKKWHSRAKTVKANKFIKTFGLDAADEILKNRRSWIDKKSGNELTDNSFVLASKTYEHAIGTLYMGNFSDYDEFSYRTGEINLLMLQRLVESHKLLKPYGNLTRAKEHRIVIALIEEYDQLKLLEKAIFDVESCQ